MAVIASSFFNDDHTPSATEPATQEAQSLEPDPRIYVPDSESWTSHVHSGTDRVYCYCKAPGQDFFHLILTGELYLQRDHEKLCLKCALHLGVATTDRLFWQHRVARPKQPPL